MKAKFSFELNVIYLTLIAYTRKKQAPGRFIFPKQNKPFHLKNYVHWSHSEIPTML